MHFDFDFVSHWSILLQVIEKSAVSRNKSTHNAVWMERFVLQSCNHPLVGTLIASFHDSARLYFVLPLAPHGELLQWLHKFPNDRFDIDTARFYTSELLMALEYLHSQDIVHRDVKPENMLLGPNLHLMLVDFGSAIALNRPNLKALSFTGTAQFVSPEMLSGFRPILAAANNPTSNSTSSNNPVTNVTNSITTSTTSSSSSESSTAETAPQSPNPVLTYLMDFWALGCVLFQFISSEMPFRSDRPGHSEIQDFEVFHKVLNLDYRFPEDFPSPEAKDLIERLLVSCPSQRLGRPEDGRHAALKSHPFFAVLDWSDEAALMERQPPEPMRTLVAAKQQSRSRREQAEAPLQNSVSNAFAPRNGGFVWAPVPSGFNAGQRYHWEKERAEGAVPVEIARPEEPLIEIEGGALVLYLVEHGAGLSTFPRREQYLARQRSSNPYHQFTKGHLILDQGILYKQRKLRARKRMFIMVENIKLLYVDPDTMDLKGIVKLSALTTFEVRNNKTFLIRTPGRDYVLNDPQEHSQEWAERVKRYWSLFFRSPS